MSAKYEYKFVKIKVKYGWVDYSGTPEQDHRQVILEHADQGWRLVQIFAPAISGYGRATYFELIFERRLA